MNTYVDHVSASTVSMSFLFWCAFKQHSRMITGCALSTLEAGSPSSAKGRIIPGWHWNDGEGKIKHYNNSTSTGYRSIFNKATENSWATEEIECFDQQGQLLSSCLMKGNTVNLLELLSLMKTEIIFPKSVFFHFNKSGTIMTNLMSNRILQ